MNKLRRKDLREITDQLETLQELLQELQEQEEEYRDNMPENLQGSEKYERADGVCVLLHCYHGDCLSLEEMQKIVEGHIQAVPTALAQGWSQEPGVGLALIVNEEGKLQNLPVNQTATDLSAAYNDVIVGNAILLGTTDEDFIGLTERAAQNIMKKWELGVC